MIILNITKFSSTTEHYYCKFYITHNAYIHHEDIKNGIYPLDEPLFHAMEKDCDAFQTIKDTNEHDLYVRAKKIIKENSLQDWRIEYELATAAHLTDSVMRNDRMGEWEGERGTVPTDAWWRQNVVAAGYQGHAQA